MDLELGGKVAIVGGASKGLGRACAQVLAEEGTSLALCSRSQKDLDTAAQEIRDTTRADVLAFAGDLDRPETIRDLVAATVGRFGRSEEHTSELQSQSNLVCRLLLEKKKKPH